MGDELPRIVFHIQYPLMQRFIAISLLLLLCFSAFSQDYKPFQQGNLHYFTSGPNYSVRIDSVGTASSDSAFWLNEVAVEPSPACFNTNTTHFVPNQEGPFGDYFVQGTGGRIQFVSRNNLVASFYTSVPTGIPWTFISNSSLTATIASRGLIMIGNTVDSVIVIDISDGNQYQLTQNHGLFSGPNLSYYLQGAPWQMASLAAVPEKPDYKDFFSWQPGDVYNFRSTNAPAWIKFERYQVLTRQEDLAGDSIVFTVQHRAVWYWQPTPISYDPIDTLRLVYTREAMRFLEMATGEPTITGQGYHLQKYWVYSTDFANRLTLVCDYYNYPGAMDSCGYGYFNVAPPCNEPMAKQFARNLGPVFFDTRVGQTMTTCLYEYHRMVCYEQASTDSLGPCPQELILLDRPEPATMAGSLSLIRNSQTGALSLGWEGMAAGNYDWQLYDLNGRLVQSATISMNASGNQAIAHPGSAGMYLLRIADTAGTWTQTLRVPITND